MKTNDSPILLVIDHFGSGGAQRQIVAIANGLVNIGLTVHIVNYYPQFEHHRNSIDKQVIIHDLRKKGKLGVGVIIGMIRLLRKYHYQSALAFLDTPAFYLEIASLFSNSDTKIFFSERSAIELKPKGVLSGLKKNLHKLTSHITSNSMVQTEMLKKYYGDNHISYIPNIMADELFQLPCNDKKFQLKAFIVLSHTRPFKNFIYVAQALVLYKKIYKSPPPVIQWYGEIYPSKELDNIKTLLSENKLQDNIVFHGAVKNVKELINDAYFLIHASLFESSANAVAEALTAATPVIVGNIPEHEAMIELSSAGYLVDLKDPLELSKVIRNAENLSSTEYIQLAQKARDYACSNHKSEQVIDKYSRLLN
jgi:glycosyltransferase involved in cell wall biosynthesis